MKITIWGCRGSLPSPGPENENFGGNTSCVEISHGDTFLILDGGSGIRRLGYIMDPKIKKIDILLTHLHSDHLIGLGFFLPLYNPHLTVNIWGPKGSFESLTERLRRYFSPPLFPVRLMELPCKLNVLEINERVFNIGGLKISNDYVCHPGPTLGFRVESDKAVFAYIPDHEPALGSVDFPNNPEWTSGYWIAEGADILLHDAQYKNDEYKQRIGWGHCSMADALKFAELAKVKKMLFFHHDPSHSDEQLRKLFDGSIKDKKFSFETGICAEGDTYNLPV
jgi:ribonuclease BN (tRNA processing enzyme)